MDDAPDSLELLAAVLGDRGAEVRTAASAAEALPTPVEAAELLAVIASLTRSRRS